MKNAGNNYLLSLFGDSHGKWDLYIVGAERLERIKKIASANRPPPLFLNVPGVITRGGGGTEHFQEGELLSTLSVSDNLGGDIAS